jgi:hypothetical protein
MNTSGERVSTALEDLEAAFDEEGIRATRDAGVDAFLADGHRFRAGLQAITHGEIHPADFDIDGMRVWLREAWTMLGEIEGVRMGLADGMTPQESLAAISMGRWVRESGLTDDQVVEELKRRVEAGESMPWE